MSSNSKFYEQLKAVNDINYSSSWAEGYGCYEQLSIMDDMNELGSHEVKPLDAMYNSNLLMIWIYLLHELTWMTLGREFKVIDDMNDLGSHEPKLLDPTNS